MNPRTLAIGISALAIAAAGGYGLYWLGMSQGMQMGSGAPTASSGAGPQHAGDVDPATGKKVLYWHDPMVPAQKFDKPGKSPFMDMQLVPVYAGAEDDKGGVAISSRVQQNLGIRTAEVTRGTLEPRLEAVGNVAYNDRDVAVVQARANGFLEKLYVRAALDPVRRGEALAELYVPDWVAAQEEFLTVKGMGSQAPAALQEGAAQRMRLAGMDDAQIRLVESTGKVHPRLTLTAPIGGVVSELAAREGMTVMAGAPLFRINGLSTIWVNAEVPENVARIVRPGAAVKARSGALPGEVFDGKVGAILPEVNPVTRTLKARIELANPHGRLVPGMFATVDFTAAPRAETFNVPSEAVIRTGTRSVVIVAEEAKDGQTRFVPVEVTTGLETNGMTAILEGLTAGQKVVASGQFLIDSEANLKATATRLSETPTAPNAEGGARVVPKAGSAAPNAQLHHAEGRIAKVAADTVTISHGAVPSLQWPAMTMGFRLPKGGIPPVKPGDRVRFDFAQRADGEYEIRSLTPEPAAIGGAQ
jgi:membrane fusion protein, copper/silver efflux system